jgi:hypothetical protein
MSVLDSIYNQGARLARAPVDGAAAALSVGRAAGRQARAELEVALDDALMAVVDVLIERLLTEDVVDRAIARVEETGVAQRVAERLLEDGIFEQIARRALAGPEFERLLAETLRGPLVEEAVTKLLENQAVWVLVDEIARSPSVTEAIAHQGTGFMDQVAGRARDRSRNADALIERLAGGLKRRRRGGDAGLEGEPPASEGARS